MLRRRHFPLRDSSDEHCSAKLLLLLAGLLVTVPFHVAPAAGASAAQCAPGFVTRDASPGDGVCVPPASKARAAYENARAPTLWMPGAYGPKTCAQGFVWREAFSGDRVCVTSEIRSLVAEENALAASRQAP
ncbi:MAG: hypothetical protein WDN24_06550 [Sphingomonas sp.]